MHNSVQPNHLGRSVPDPVTLSSVPELNSPQNWEFEYDLYVQPAPMGFVNPGLAKLKPSPPSSNDVTRQELLNDLALPAVCCLPPCRESLRDMLEKVTAFALMAGLGWAAPRTEQTTQTSPCFIPKHSSPTP